MAAYVAGLGAIVLLAAGAAGAPADAPPADARPGGDTTLPPGRRPGLAASFANLTLRERYDLAVGRAFFRDPWVEAPATTIARDGLGPLFNAHACASCHPDGGRGALGPDGAPSAALLLRLARAGERGPIADPVYGDQLQTLAIDPGSSPGSSSGAAPGGPERAVREAVVDVRYAARAGRYPDGAAYALRKPEWLVVDAAYGPLHAGTRTSPRLAPSLRGAGLLAAIPEAAIRRHADPDDLDGDGVSGRAHEVPDRARGGTALGRFGWKASQPTLRQQVASALRNDVGITSELYADQPCTDSQSGCRAAPGGGDPPSGHEIPPHLLDALTRFAATLALPARPRAEAPELRAGAATFAQIGCARCHVPSFVTGAAPGLPQAQRQTVWPYTDLLLHDMGPDLADEVGEVAASGSEWRTAPLWDLGRAARDPARTNLLHDGRARSIEEAVLWHGGEAERARDAFAGLPASGRASLLAFLASL